MSISSRLLSAFAAAALAALPVAAHAQATFPYEIGVDGVIAHRDYDHGSGVTTVSLPVNTLRVGMFVTSQIELEPSLSFQRISIDDDDRSQIDLSIAAPIYFTPERTKPQVFVRPVVGLYHISDPEGTQVNVGAGLGLKLPIDSRIATRLEAEYRHGNGGDDFVAYNQFGLILGFSVYTH